ncbi:MAG: thiamine phosphate synthase, partial [Armatimonadota bacterium]
MPQALFRSRLCFIADAASATAHALLRQVDAAVAGGAGLVQYVPGEHSTREMVALGMALLTCCRKSHIPLIVRG